VISILITIKDRQDYFQRQLEFLEKNLEIENGKYEIIFFDDGSEVELKKVQSKLEYKLVRSRENLGLIQARNELSKLIDKDSKYILFIDDDIFIHNLNLFISQSVSILEQESSIAAVSCPYINLPTFKYEKISTFKSILKIDKKDDFVVYFFGGTSIFNRSIFEEFAGLEGLYQIYLEEEDLAFRMFAKGLYCRILYNKNVIAIHDQAPGKNFTQRNVYLLSNRLLYHYKFIENGFVRFLFNFTYICLYAFKMKNISLFIEAINRYKSLKIKIVRYNNSSTKFFRFMVKRYLGL
jgi:GT2 family glycosyltransferase